MHKRKHILFYLLGFLLGTAILVVAGAVVVRFIVIPTVVRIKVYSQLESSWPGPADIDGLSFDLSGRVEIDRLDLEDQSGQVRLRNTGVTILVPGWKQKKYDITEVRIRTSDIQLFPKPRSKSTGTSRSGSPLVAALRGLFPLEVFEVNDVSVTVYHEKQPQIAFDNLYFATRPEQNVLKLDLKQKPVKGAGTVVLEASVNMDNLDARLQLDLAHYIRHVELVAINSLLGSPLAYTAEGNLTLKVSMQGNLEAPQSFTATGRGRLSNHIIFKENQPFIESLRSNININGRRCELPDIAGRIYGGEFTGSISIQAPPAKLFPPTVSGNLCAENIDYNRLKGVEKGTPSPSEGRASICYDFNCPDARLANLEGSGNLSMDHVDMSVQPVIAAIFGIVGLKGHESLRASDAVAKFRNTGMVVTIDDCYITNSFAAIKFEPGFTVDVQKKYMDGHVVSVPLRALDTTVKKVPLARDLYRLTERLVRLRVEGYYGESTRGLVRKEPLEDVSAGTVDFFGDVIKSGGEITGGMLRSFGSLFKSNSK